MHANPCDQYPDSIPHNVPCQKRDPHWDIPDLYSLRVQWALQVRNFSTMMLYHA
jgi:hypothetical protein